MKLDSAKKEEELLKSVRSDKNNFTEFYSKYFPKIKEFFSYRINDQIQAEDLTSQVFEKALRGIDNFQWQGIPFSAWLYRIARNTLIDFYRASEKQKKQIAISETNTPSSEDMAPHKTFEILSDNELLYMILNELPPKEKDIVYMKFFDGYSNKLIAKLTGLSETNVGTIVYRTMQSLREKYNQITKR